MRFATMLIVVATMLLASISVVFVQTYRALLNPIRVPIRYDSPSRLKVDKDVGFVMIPSLDIEINIRKLTQRIFTDTKGFRSPTKDMLAPSSADIVTIGCSQTWGSGVTAEETFAFILGESLKKISVNLGVGAYSGVTSLKWLQKNWQLKPKIVVYGYWFDHDIRNVCPCAPNYVEFCVDQPYVLVENKKARLVPPKSISGSGIKDTHNLIEAAGTGRDKYSLISDLYWLFRRDLLRIKVYLGLAETWNAKPLAEREIGTRHFLQKLAFCTNRNGAKLIVVYMPDYLNGNPMPQMPAFIPQSLDNLDNVELIDMTPEFSQIMDAEGNEALQVPGDGHLSSTGHKLVAQKVLQLIVGKQLIPMDNNQDQ